MARRVQDLSVWQLADEIRTRVYALSATGTVIDDRRFRDQTMDAAASVCRNVSEGFGRYRHREFANYLIIARGSLFELSDHMRDGMLRGHWDAATCTEVQSLCNRAIAATTKLIRYLKTHSDP